MSAEASDFDGKELSGRAGRAGAAALACQDRGGGGVFGHLIFGHDFVDLMLMELESIALQYTYT